MFQIIFNELSAAEISALPKRLQLELLAEFQIYPKIWISSTPSGSA